MEGITYWMDNRSFIKYFNCVVRKLPAASISFPFNRNDMQSLSKSGIKEF